MSRLVANFSPMTASGEVRFQRLASLIALPNTWPVRPMARTLAFRGRDRCVLLVCVRCVPDLLQTMLRVDRRRRSFNWASILAKLVLDCLLASSA